MAKGIAFTATFHTERVRLQGGWTSSELVAIIWSTFSDKHAFTCKVGVDGHQAHDPNLGCPAGKELTVTVSGEAVGDTEAFRAKVLQITAAVQKELTLPATTVVFSISTAETVVVSSDAN
ncbi:MAG: hypothetical protein EBQ80_02000 [Proteobacteria bacterium]|nr:hypothetical protein [Pseudomonadota bacterium]